MSDARRPAGRSCCPTTSGSTCCWSRPGQRPLPDRLHRHPTALALVGPETRLFVTDFRYVEQAAEEVDGVVRAPDRAPRTCSRRSPSAARRASSRLAFEDAQMTVRAHDRLRELLPERVELVAGRRPGRAPARGQGARGDRADPAPRPSSPTRRCASCMERAGRADRARAWRIALEAGCASAAPRALASTRSSPPARTARCRTRSPRDVQIERGELVVIDWGAELDGYCSDCTRTVATGELADSEARRSTSWCSRRSSPACEAVAPGVGGRDVDAAARAVIDAGGPRRALRPRARARRRARGPRGAAAVAALGPTLATGNVVTVEPGVYLPGRVRGADRGSRRSSPTTGCEILTSVPKELDHGRLTARRVMRVGPSSAAPRSGRCTRAICSAGRWRRRFRATCTRSRARSPSWCASTSPSSTS